MPNMIERLFRAIFLYTSLYWLVVGLWGVPQAWVIWDSLDGQGIRNGNELYFLLVLIFIYGGRLIVGWVGFCYFRELAVRQHRQIPHLEEQKEPRWHDTGVFATLLATLTGLYCLSCYFYSLPDLFMVFSALGVGYGDFTGISIIDVWYYHWQAILFSGCCLIFAILLLVHTGKIAMFVTQMIETTPPKKDDLYENDTRETETAKGESDEQAR